MKSIMNAKTAEKSGLELKKKRNLMNPLGAIDEMIGLYRSVLTS